MVRQLWQQRPRGLWNFCGGAYYGKKYGCSSSPNCLKDQGVRRGYVVKRLLQGKDVVGLAEDSILRKEAAARNSRLKVPVMQPQDPMTQDPMVDAGEDALDQDESRPKKQRLNDMGLQF